MGKGRQEKCVPNRVQSCSTRMPGIVQCQIEGSEFKNIFQDYDFMRVLVLYPFCIVYEAF
jgi:hypothetical protein